MRIIAVNEIKRILLNFLFLTVIEITIPRMSIPKIRGRRIIIN